MADNIYLKAIDALIEFWQTEDFRKELYNESRSAAESREQSAEIIRRVVEAEGSWDWALAQMKAGKKVWYEPLASSEWDHSYVRLKENDQVFITAWGGLWSPRLSELERTDWRIVDGE